MKFVICFAALGAIAAVLLSHTEHVYAGPDPADARAAVPSNPYRSPFYDYRPLGDEKLLPWKASNDEVARIGGWRVYAKEAREPQTANPAPEPIKPVPQAPKSPAPAAPAHAGHGQPK